MSSNSIKLVFTTRDPNIFASPPVRLLCKYFKFSAPNSGRPWFMQKSCCILILRLKYPRPFPLPFQYTNSFKTSKSKKTVRSDLHSQPMEKKMQSPPGLEEKPSVRIFWECKEMPRTSSLTEDLKIY